MKWEDSTHNTSPHQQYIYTHTKSNPLTTEKWFRSNARVHGHIPSTTIAPPAPHYHSNHSNHSNHSDPFTKAIAGMVVLRTRARVYGHTTTNMPKTSTPPSMLPSIARYCPVLSSYCPLLLQVVKWFVPTSLLIDWWASSHLFNR